MKTKDFIALHAQHLRQTPDSSPHHISKRCSSVICRDNTIYSYGTHYPMLFPVHSRSGDVILVLNGTGYSSSTARHISHARPVADVMIRNLPPRHRDWHTIAEQLTLEIAHDQATYNALKRKDTQKARFLLEDIERTKKYLVIINS